MKKLNFMQPKSSLRIKLTLSVFIMTLPLVIMLLYNNFYAIHVVREQVADSYKNTLTLHMNQIDSNLNDIDSYMNSLVGNGYDLISIKLAESDDQYYLSKSYLFTKLSQDIALYDSLGAFFVYVKDKNDYMDVYSSQISYPERDSMKAYIVAMIDEQTIPKGIRTQRWQHAQVGDEHYLFNIIQTGEVYFGGWIKAEELLKPLKALKMGEGGVALLSDTQGKPITSSSFVYDHGISIQENLDDHYISGTERKYVVVGTESYRGNFKLIALIPDRNILANLPYLQQLIWVITIAVLFFIPVGLYFMRQTFLDPIKRLLLTMSRVRVGDWGVRVNLEKDAEEFRILGHSFNTMMTEIQTLRINVFEEQLNKQREELQRLQLQVNPHFFLNALNIVYNLAKVKNYELIKEMSSALINYFRFLFRSNTSFVKLKDELEHTRNYLGIQALRFPGQLVWRVDAPAYLEYVPVPPLIIQSFVENSIKHAITMEEPLDIAVQVGFEDHSDGSRMKITISDSGPGFDDMVLRELQAGRSVETERGERTGIWNVQRRLKLLYHENITIQYDNNEQTGGAVVDIILPIHPEREE